MKWIYISPHFDDAVLSCGGLIWEQVQSGSPVEIWTVCAAQPAPGTPLSPFALSLHERWQTGTEAVLERRDEDEAAAAEVGARVRFGALADCIYRILPDGSFLVNGEDDLWVPVNPQESGVIHDLAAWFAEAIQPGDRVVCPMALGDHVDHRLARAAAESLGIALSYYPDYPYVVRDPHSLSQRVLPGWQRECWPVSRDGLAAWQRGIACYSSQISTFWGGLEEMRASMERYWAAEGGGCLYTDKTVK